MSDFTIVNLQDLEIVTGLTENDFLAIGQGDKALTKATIQQVGTFLGITSAVKIGDKNTAPTEPSFAFADAGTYTEWGNVEIIGDLGILIFDGTDFSKTEINFVANGVVEEGNTQAVSGGEVYDKVVNNSDLDIETANLFNPDDVVVDKLINSTGQIQAVAGWHMAKIDVSKLIGQNISFFGKTGSQGLYYAFYKVDNTTMISSDGYNPTLVKTLVVPAESKWLYIDIKRPNDVDVSVYAEFRVNIGENILPYSPYSPIINAIKGIPLLGSGDESYDQSLNTTDDVIFNKVTANEVDIPGTLKSGTLVNPPIGLIIGEFWLDTTDSTSNPIIRQKIQ